MKKNSLKKRRVRRRKKSIFSNFFFSFFLFFFIIFSSALGFLLFSPRFQIQEMIISGNNNISTEDIEKIATDKFKISFSFMGFNIDTESIFLSFGNKVNEIKEALPEIDRVSIKKNFPSGISIEIIEKEPFAIWSFNEETYLVDKNGSFIKNFSDNEDYFSLIKINQKEEFNNINKKEILNSLDKIKLKLEEYSIGISSFDLFNDKTKANTDESFPIIFNLDQNLDWQIEKLVIVFEKNNYLDKLGEIEYIDLNYENQVVIKSN